MSINNKLHFSLLMGIATVLASLARTAAQVSSPPANPSSYGMTSGRLVATLAAVVALIGVVAGGVALVRPEGRFATGRFVALAAGLIGAGVGGLRVITAGGIGTGGGRAGAIVALVLGLIATALGVFASPRARRSNAGEPR